MQKWNIAWFLLNRNNFSGWKRFIMVIEILQCFKVMLFLYFSENTVSQRSQADTPGE